MKKSFSTIAFAAILFASCQKSNEVTPASTDLSTNNASLNLSKSGDDNLPKHSGKDDTGTDDNLPKHSGKDDAGTDDNLPKHSGKDEKSTNVPAKVSAAFSKYFPGAKVSEWKLTSDGTYKAHFTKNGISYEATFKADGTLIKTEKNK